MSSSSGSAESCCYLGSPWNVSPSIFFPLGHHLNWLSASLLPLQVPAESMGSSDLCKSDQVGPLGLGGVRGKGVLPSRYFSWSEVAACAEKYPGEGGSNFDRQVTDRRWYLPGKYSQTSQQKEFYRLLPAERN